MQTEVTKCRKPSHQENSSFGFSFITSKPSYSCTARNNPSRTSQITCWASVLPLFCNLKLIFSRMKFDGFSVFLYKRYVNYRSFPKGGIQYAEYHVIWRPLNAEVGIILLIYWEYQILLSICIWPQIPNTFKVFVFDPKY